MRVNRIQAEENRQNVINVASRLFRSRGFDGIGLKDLMEAAGLTQGAFYKQFASKEDLAAQASARALESATLRWSAATAAEPEDPLGAVVAFYLSLDHRDETLDGCPIVAVGSDVARQGSNVKASFEAGIKVHIEILGRLIAEANDRNQGQSHGHSLDDGRCADALTRRQRPRSGSVLFGNGVPTDSRSRRRLKDRPSRDREIACLAWLK
jgi:TetR/AcrR family transcriptional repressor of nem operon